MKIFLTFFLYAYLCHSKIILRDWSGDLSLPRTNQLFKNMPLYRFDTIETKNNSRAMLLLGSNLKIYLGDETKIIIENNSLNKLIIKFYNGILRIDELQPSQYQIKSPSGFVSGSKKISSYFFLTRTGRTELICLNGEKDFFNFNIKYDGSIPNGFIFTKKGGRKINKFTKSNILIGENNDILPPSQIEKLENSHMKHYYEATIITKKNLLFSKETFYEIASRDTPVPSIDLEILTKDFQGGNELKINAEPHYFNPERKEAFSIDHIE